MNDEYLIMLCKNKFSCPFDYIANVLECPKFIEYKGQDQIEFVSM